jgi:flavodoxin I
MKKAILVYWPKHGNVEKAAAGIAGHFSSGSLDVFTIAQIEAVKLKDYDLLIFGGSTVGADHWEDAHTSKWYSFFEQLKEIDLKGKKAAIFGLGDQVLYPDHFVDGMAIIRDELFAAGAEIIGAWPVAGYEHTESKAQEGDHFIGLALDEDQQAELTDKRIADWVDGIKKEAM